MNNNQLKQANQLAADLRALVDLHTAAHDAVNDAADFLADLSADQPQEQPLNSQEDLRELLRPYLQEDGSIKAPAWSDAAKLLRSAAPVQPASQINDAVNMVQPASKPETATCTLCAGIESPGFYTGCMIKDDNCKDSGWDCDGKGNLTRCNTSSKEPAKTLLESHLNYTSQVLGHTSSKEASEAAQGPDGYMCFDSKGEAHAYSPKSKPIKGVQWEPVYRRAAQPAPARDDVLEAAAKVCEARATWANGDAEDESKSRNLRAIYLEQQLEASLCAASIRALQSQPAPEAGKAGAIPESLRRELKALGEKWMGEDGRDELHEALEKCLPTPEAAPMPAQAVTLTDQAIDEALVAESCNPQLMTHREVRHLLKGPYIHALDARNVFRRLLSGSAKTDKTGEAG